MLRPSYCMNGPHHAPGDADYAANALAWAPQIRRDWMVRGAYPGAATSTVDERDGGAVAVRALLEPGHAGQTYLLTGPEPLTPADLLGRPARTFAAWAGDHVEAFR